MSPTLTIADSILGEEPSDERRPALKKMPGGGGARRKAAVDGAGSYPALAGRQPAPEGAPRTLEEVIAKHGLPLKPPGHGKNSKNE